MPSAPLLTRPRRGEPDQLMGPQDLPAPRAPQWLGPAGLALSGAYAPSCDSVALSGPSSPLPHLNCGVNPKVPSACAYVKTLSVRSTRPRPPTAGTGYGAGRNRLQAAQRPAW